MLQNSTIKNLELLIESEQQLKFNQTLKCMCKKASIKSREKPWWNARQMFLPDKSEELMLRLVMIYIAVKRI